MDLSLASLDGRPLFCKSLYMKTKRVSYLILTGSDSSAECVCIRLFPFFHHKYLNWIIGQLNQLSLISRLSNEISCQI